MSEHTKPPGSIYTAFGAQPAEAELTDEDIQKCDLLTVEELDSLTNDELQYILDFPLETVKTLVEEMRKKVLDKPEEM